MDVMPSIAAMLFASPATMLYGMPGVPWPSWLAGMPRWNSMCPWSNVRRTPPHPCTVRTLSSLLRVAS
eukprot:2484050-Amphidinium_carterae.1